MDRPFISFIIPVFNREQETAEAVKCIVDSGFASYEIILINDASTDRSGLVCDKLEAAFPFVKALHNGTNKGPGYSRNVGIREATGDYLYFLDSDDLIQSELLMQLSEVLTQNTDVDILTMNHKTVTPDGEKDICLFDFESKLQAEELLVRKPAILHTEMWRHVFKTAFVRAHQLQVPDVKIGEDTCFVAQAYLLASYVYVLPRIFCIHRHFPNESGSLVASATWQQYVDGFELCAKTLDRFCQEHTMTAAAEAAVDAYIYSCVIPLFKALPLKQLNFGKERMYARIGQEKPAFKIDLALFRRFGLLDGAYYAWTALLESVIRASREQEVFLSPAGGVSAAIADKLILSGAAIAGFLDNHAGPNNFYVADTNKHFAGRVFSFEQLKAISHEGKSAFVVVLGSSNTAMELSKQLRDSQLEFAFSCGL